MGEAVLVLFGLALAGYLLVAPIVAFSFAVRAHRKNDDLLARIRHLERRVAELSAHRRHEPLPTPLLRATAPTAPAADEPTPAPVGAAIEGVPPAAPPHAAPMPAPRAVIATAASGAPAASSASSPALPEIPSTGTGPALRVEPPAPAAPLPATDGPSIEERLGLTWLTRAGAAAFLIGALFFFKYAADNQWIGPTGRVAIGAATGTLLLVAAEVARRRTRRRFVHALLGIGLATLFVSVWASAALYELTPTSVAFVADTVLLLLGAALAFRHRAEAILVLVLVAGFLNPVVLSTGQDRPLALFGYLLLITSVVQAVSGRLDFRVAPWLAIAGNAALFCGWYGRYFDASDRRGSPWLDQPPETLVGPYLSLASRAVPLAFVALASLQGAALSLWLRARALAAAAAPSPPVDASLASPSVSARAAPPVKASVKAIAVASFMLAHAGAGMLLLDAPRTLAVAGIALAIASVATLRALGAAGWLLAPMGVAFLAFAAVCPDAPEPQRPLIVGLLALSTLVYLAGWLRGVDRTRGLEPGTAIACAAGAALFAGLAAMLLLEPEPALFAFVLTSTSALVAFLALRAALSGLLLAGALVSACALAATAPGSLAPGPPPRVDARFLAAAALWVLVHLGAVLAVARRTPAPRPSSTPQPSVVHAPILPWTAVLAASVATLTFVAVSLGATPAETPTLRALLTAGAGIADLGLGAALLRALLTADAPAARAGDRVAALLGQALALFAAAIAFGVGGATATVLWGILAAVAAAIAAHTGERIWLGVSALLFLAALVRALGVDLLATEELVTTWFETRGRDGQMSIPVLFNPRAYAFAGLGVSLLAAGRLLARAAPITPFARADLRAGAVFAASSGYALLLATVVIEVRSTLTVLPAPPPVPLDAAEFAQLAAACDAALFAQRGSLSMATTLIFALAAIALLTAGFVARDAFHRYAGLVLFLITAAKLALWDIWRIERIYQIALFTGVGALLVIGGFLYARFGRRLAAIMRDGPPAPRTSTPAAMAAAAPGKPGSTPVPPGVAGLLLVLALGGATRAAEAQPASALPTAKLALVRPIEGVTGPGDHRLDVDLDLYRQSLADDLLADLRIAGPGGAEVPYLVREIGAALPSGRIPAALLDPGIDTAGAVRATWALDVPGTRHCRVELSVLGATFLREVRVETGEDAKSMNEVARGAYVYRIRRGSETIEHLAISYPLSSAELLRVTLLPEPNGALPGGPGRAPRPGDALATDVRITGGTVSCEPPPSLAPVQLIPLSMVESRRDAEAKTTVVTLDAGADGVPLQAVVLDVATAEFSRTVEIASTTYRAVWPPAGSGPVYRIRPRGAGGVELALTRLPLTPTRKRWLRLTIHDGDSAPLTINGAQGEVRAREIVLRTEVAGPHRLYVGDALGARPSYDLADILDRADREPPPAAAQLGPAQPNPGFGVEATPRDLPFTERYRREFGIGLVAALLALSLWAVKLLREAGKPGGAGSESESDADSDVKSDVKSNAESDVESNVNAGKSDTDDERKPERADKPPGA